MFISTIIICLKALHSVARRVIKGIFVEIVFINMMRLLRRLKLIGESFEVSQNSAKLKKRQAQQLSLLTPLSKLTDKTLLDKNIS